MKRGAPDLSLARFERRLAAYRVPAMPGAPLVSPVPLVSSGGGAAAGTVLMRTAVAAVLRFDRGVPDVLLMKRAVRAGDLWSGHISLPGGRASPADPDLLATATRETHEEVGVDLHATARVIGQLEAVQAVARGRPQSVVIAPFVFVQTRPAPIELGPEAQAAFWLPLDRAAAGDLTGEYDYQFGAETGSLPCWRYEGHVVWGLTYRMLDSLLQVVTGADED